MYFLTQECGFNQDLAWFHFTKELIFELLRNQTCLRVSNLSPSAGYVAYLIYWLPYVVLSCSLLVSYVASQRCNLILLSSVTLIHIFSAVSVGVGIVASCIRCIILIYHVSVLNSLNCMLCPWPIFSTSCLFEFHLMLMIYVVGFFFPRMPSIMWCLHRGGASLLYFLPRPQCFAALRPLCSQMSPWLLRQRSQDLSG